jgi:hypothetical protein
MNRRLCKDELLALGHITYLDNNMNFPPTMTITPYKKTNGLSKQKHFGDQCENSCIKLKCIQCYNQLYNVNSFITNCPAIDLQCTFCDTNYQVKGFSDPNQLHVNKKNELELKQGGSHHIISPFVRDNLLIYIFVNYNPDSSKINQIIYSSILQPNDVVGPVGQGKKCRIIFRNPIVIFFD